MLQYGDYIFYKELYNSIMIAASERWLEFDESHSWILLFRPEGKWRTMRVYRDGKTADIGTYNVPELPGVQMAYNGDVDTLVINLEAIKLRVVLS